MSFAEYENLRAQAIGNHWSARGRNLSAVPESARLYLIAFGPDPSAGMRCVVAVHLAERDISIFTLDVSEKSFDSLSGISDDGLVQLVHDMIMLFPPIPIDEGED